MQQLILIASAILLLQAGSLAERFRAAERYERIRILNEHSRISEARIYATLANCC